jgi:hypothetical protein
VNFLTPQSISLAMSASQIFVLAENIDCALLKGLLQQRGANPLPPWASRADVAMGDKLKLLLFFAEELAKLRETRSSAAAATTGAAAS